MAVGAKCSRKRHLKSHRYTCSTLQVFKDKKTSKQKTNPVWWHRLLVSVFSRNLKLDAVIPALDTTSPTPIICLIGHSFSGRPHCLWPLPHPLPVVFLGVRCPDDFGFYTCRWFIEMTTVPSIWLMLPVCPRQGASWKSGGRRRCCWELVWWPGGAELPVYFFRLLPCMVSG